MESTTDRPPFAVFVCECCGTFVVEVPTTDAYVWSDEERTQLKFTRTEALSLMDFLRECVAEVEAAA
jgi:hypothetical protein